MMSYSVFLNYFGYLGSLLAFLFSFLFSLYFIYIKLFKDDLKTVTLADTAGNIIGKIPSAEGDLYEFEELTLIYNFKIIMKRLDLETTRLKRTSNKNLLFGLGFVVASLFLITVFYIILPNSSDDILKILQFWIPRFFAVLLVQFTSFFFLRLYVANELDIKHNKNEMTNIESKMLAALLAKESGDKANLKLVIQELAKTERNFILKKDEKTTSIEGKEHYNDMKDFFNKFIDKIPSVKNNNPTP